MEFIVWGLKFEVLNFVFGVWGFLLEFGLKILRLGFWVCGVCNFGFCDLFLFFGIENWSLELWIMILGFWVRDLSFWILGFGILVFRNWSLVFGFGITSLD